MTSSPSPDTDVIFGPLAENYFWPLAVSLTLFIVGLVWAGIKSQRFRSGLWRAVKWPFTVRLTTTRRLRAREQTGWDRRQQELDEERARPVPRPRWTVGKAREGGPNTYILANTAGDAVARFIELHTTDRFFHFYDAARWEEVEGVTALRFTGQRTNDGALFGVPFIVTWHDANGDPQHAEVKLPDTF